ncbi:MAG: hypothetical protein FWG94_09095, partial [Oscillospiraceae bacterium]|nr:hypothetical protein [Oscillospiraceae bacterium]
ELAGRGEITVKALGREIIIPVSVYSENEIGAENELPGVIIETEDGSDPEFEYIFEETPVDDPSNIVLMIEELGGNLGNPATPKGMMRNAMSEKSGTNGWPNLDEDWSGWDSPQNSRWFDIYLADANDNHRRVKPTNAASKTINLPHPTGASRISEYLVVHSDTPFPNEDDINSDTIEDYWSTLIGNIYWIDEDGFSFIVESFSPYVVIWKNPEPPGPPGPNPGPSPGSGTRGSSGAFGGSSPDNDFWYQVRWSITRASPGEAVIASVPYSYETIPVSVLRVLQGKDITLTIKWRGRTLHINGKDVILSDPLTFTYYTLEELFELYGISKDQDENLAPDTYDPGPVTGGDGITLLASDGRVLAALPAVPEISAHITVLAQPAARIPALPPVIRPPDIGASQGGAVQNTASQHINSLNFTVMGLSLLLFSAVLAAIGLGYAFVQGGRVGEVEAPDVRDLPVTADGPQISARPPPEPVVYSVPEPPAVQVNPDEIQKMIRPKARPVAKTPVREREDKQFMGMIERQKRLKEDFENGVITKTEYEQHKKKLMCL